MGVYYEDSRGVGGDFRGGCVGRSFFRKRLVRLVGLGRVESCCRRRGSWS